jgi:hypothetical protein
METLYALLGLLFGIALAELVHWRTRNARLGGRIPLGVGRRRSSAPQPSATANSAGRFTAQDYYDR